MAAAPPPAMSKSDLKALLLKSKKEPVNCAFGLGKDKQALILLHKTKSPPILVKDLELQNGAAMSSKCYGTAMVDADVDPKLVVFTVNKAIGGVAAKLKKVLGPAGYPRITIQLEDGSVVESSMGDDEAEEGGIAGAEAAGAEAAEQPAAAAPTAMPDQGAAMRELAALAGRIGAAAGADTALKARLATLARDANGLIKSGEPGGDAMLAQLRESLDAAESSASSAPAAGPDADALKRQLGVMIAGIGPAAAADPALKAPLMKLATEANASLKANDSDAAAGLIEQLRAMLAGAGAGKSDGAAPQQADALGIWLAAKERAGEQIGKLQDAMRAQRHPLFDRIADMGLNGVTGRLQVGLQVALMNVNAASGEARTKAQATARSAVADFRGFLRSDPVLPFIENNPLGVPVTLRAGLSRALDAIDRSLTT